MFRSDCRIVGAARSERSRVAYFLRYCLLIGTDRVLLLMVRRRVADLWRRATKDANQVLIHWADLYRELLDVDWLRWRAMTPRWRISDDPYQRLRVAGGGALATQAADARAAGA
jgi:hypothetical protein